MNSLDQTTVNPGETRRAAASRRNALLSTGPRTPQGKSRSSQNARTHGWFARNLRVAEGQREIYLACEQAARDLLDPVGPLEEDVFLQFVRASWHRREVLAAQKQNGIPPRRLALLYRYEIYFERRGQHYRAELRRLQAVRRNRGPQELGTLPALPWPFRRAA